MQWLYQFYLGGPTVFVDPGDDRDIPSAFRCLVEDVVGVDDDDIPSAFHCLVEDD